MKKRQKLIIVIVFQVFGLASILAQNATILSIHEIGPALNHYAELKQLDSKPRPDQASLDTIVYPPELYKNKTLLFALTKPYYLSTDQVDFLVDAVEFPANSSEQTKAELAFLLELQEKRTDEQVKNVLEMASVGYWPDVNSVKSHPNYKRNLEDLFFECEEVIGVACTYDKYPETSRLLQGVMNDMRLMEFSVKYHLFRARPYQLEVQLKPLKIMAKF